jgi:hypothetical protein
MAHALTSMHATLQRKTAMQGISNKHQVDACRCKSIYSSAAWGLDVMSVVEVVAVHQVICGCFQCIAALIAAERLPCGLVVCIVLACLLAVGPVCGLRKWLRLIL